MLCNKCGKENAEGTVFCSGCGNRIDIQQPMQSPTPVQPAVQPVQPTPVVPVQPVEPVLPTQPVVSNVPVQPVVQPVQPVMPVQPIQSNNQFGQPQYQNTNGDDKTKKFIILGLLALLVIVLLAVVIVVLNTNNSTTKNPGSGNGAIAYTENSTRTIMIYIVGSNLESQSAIVTSDLGSIDPNKIDLDKINVLLYTGGTEKWHNFISNQENAIYKLTKEGFVKLETYPKKNMGDPSTLSSFLTYGYENFKTDYYSLILYDHGGAIDGAIYDDFTDDNLSLEDFSKALSSSTFNSNNKLDNVIFRTCLNGTLEVASIFADYARYIIFSEEYTMGANTTNVLGYFLDGLKPTHGGALMGEKFIESYQKQMDDIDIIGLEPITYSIVDLSKIKNVVTELDNYISTIDLTNHYKEISSIRKQLYQYGGDSESFDTVDLYEVIKQISPYSSGSSDNLFKSMDEAVVKNYTNLDKSHGLSIYLPYKGNKTVVERFLKVYQKLDFSVNYRNFISSFYGIKGQAQAFSFDPTKKQEIKEEDNEVHLVLTDEQKDKIVAADYVVFRQDEKRPKYYQQIYYSNNATVEDGVVKTHFNNKLIKFYNSQAPDEKQYILVNDFQNDNNNKKYVRAIIYDTDKDIFSGEFMVSSNLLIEDHDGVPQFGNMELISRDERVQGIIYDTSKYETVEIYQAMSELLDDKGNLMKPSEWTSPNTHYGIGASFDEARLEYTGMDEGNFYVLFVLYDYNNNGYLSKLIKVGDQ